MNKLISFCINTTKSELDFLKLLFHSLNINLDNKNHEILVFIENDTEKKDVQLFLLSQKSIFSDLKIIINPLPIPIGYANNINILFKMAKYDVVSYIQSDMCIGPKYDYELLKSILKFDENIILSSLRVEPPLHSSTNTNETYVKNFGLTPEEIKLHLNEFYDFCNIIKNDIKITEYFFAPFTLYKNKWINHDTLFRRSREDSDILYRMVLSGYDIKQCWNAIVYHRSCVSSRGNNFFNNKGSERIQLQNVADSIEMSRFLRKWPKFKHTTTFDINLEYKYQISANFKNVTYHNGHSILQNYYRFNKIYIDNEMVRNLLKIEYNKFHNPANQLLNISTEQWNQYKKYYQTWEFEDIFVSSPVVDNDIILNLNPQTMDIFTNPIILQLNDIIHTSAPGMYECGTGTLTINKIINRIHENIIVKNPSIDDIKFEIL